MTPTEAAAAVVSSFLDKSLVGILAAVAGYWFGFHKGRQVWKNFTVKNGDESYTMGPM